MRGLKRGEKHNKEKRLLLVEYSVFQHDKDWAYWEEAGTDTIIVSPCNDTVFIRVYRDGRVLSEVPKFADVGKQARVAAALPDMEYLVSLLEEALK